MAYTSIDDPTIFFNTVLYSGSNGTQSVTGINFQPDFSWLKCRSTAYHNRLFNSVSGAGKNLISDNNNSEQTVDEGITAFNSDGFSVKQGSSLEYNASGQTYVSWNWLASGSTASNTDGSVTSTVSANTTAGFSISTFTSPGSGTFTFGHGLSSAPKVVILKRRNGSQNWIVGHDSAGWGYWLKLNDTDARLSNTSMWQNTAPSSSIVSLDTSQIGASNTFVAYCLSEVKGYSKFSSYTGNGNADGPFIYTGFRPAWLLVRNATESSMQWVIHDNKRNTFNVTDKELRPDSTEAEVTQTRFDFVSNGFKVRNSSSYVNRSGETIIYMAFAESPFVNSNSVPNKAR